MDILFDSNVILELEGPDKVLPESIADMVRMAQELGYRIYTHPCQVEDLGRDRDEKRKRIQLSKLRQYPVLVNPPTPNKFELMENGWGENNDNDRCDNLLLFAVKRSAVRFLITEDRRMHAKARRAKIGEQVFFVEEFLSLLKQQQAQKLLITNCVSIQNKYLYQINLQDEFFDSLRANYGGDKFDAWYKRCAEEKRQAWVVEDKGRIRALCVFKEEHDEIVTDANERLLGKSLKLCTFKVADRGKKLGERLLFVAFRAAQEHAFDYVYVQVRELGQSCLLDLLQEYGFVRLGEYHNDVTYVKDMRGGIAHTSLCADERLEFDILHYPHFLSDASVKKYIVPIKPEFHDRLFPDLNSRPTLFDAAFGLDSEANAIKKAYICRSPIKTLQPSDLLMFYCSHGDKRVRCIGIVEATKRSANAEEIMSFVSKRTVYSFEEIASLIKGGETIAILFRVVRYLTKAISADELKSAKVPWPIQTICNVSEAMFERLREERDEDFS